MHTEVGCLAAGRAAVVDELGMFLDGHFGLYEAGDISTEVGAGAINAGDGERVCCVCARAAKDAGWVAGD
jgi:hypothetical protein